ncbi:uncharacterized protein DS421_10g309150 [Arachis hypogaea]|nr:uncharacterized protein LOC112718344 [Arachis hypogaea]QHO17078.1 uncharacterized protein DS421_10g309150 [Arachis hypogaea]QHO17079.1 uncharacterized protein DS421_10g309150 [Arachis hypogaea]
MSASYPEDVQSSEPGFISATLSIFESVRSLGQSESMSSPQPQSQPQTQTQTQQPSLSLRNDQNNEGTRSKRRRDKANVADESTNPGQSKEPELEPIPQLIDEKDSGDESD